MGPLAIIFMAKFQVHNHGFNSNIVVEVEGETITTEVIVYSPDHDTGRVLMVLDEDDQTVAMFHHWDCVFRTDVATVSVTPVKEDEDE